MEEGCHIKQPWILQQLKQQQKLEAPVKSSVMTQESTIHRNNWFIPLYYPHNEPILAVEKKKHSK